MKATLKRDQEMLTGITLPAGTEVEVLKLYEDHSSNRLANVRRESDDRRICGLPIERLDMTGVPANELDVNPEAPPASKTAQPRSLF